MEKHGAKSGFEYLQEIRVESAEGFEPGQEITVEQFAIGDSRGRHRHHQGPGLCRRIKRQNFRGGPMSHGSMYNRAPGSIGASAYPSRVVTGKKMPGHMGNARVTRKNLEVVDVRPEDNLLLVKGAVPGPQRARVHREGWAKIMATVGYLQH